MPSLRLLEAGVPLVNKRRLWSLKAASVGTSLGKEGIWAQGGLERQRLLEASLCGLSPLGIPATDSATLARPPPHLGMDTPSHNLSAEHKPFPKAFGHLQQ